MYLFQTVQSYTRYLQNRVEKLTSRIERYPEGTLHCYPDRKGYITYISYKGRPRKYLPKSERTRAAYMAQKAVYESELKDNQIELEACRQYLKVMQKYPHAAEKLMQRPGMNELVGPDYRGSDAYVQKWIHEPYEKNQKYPESLEITTPTGEKVRSKSELLCSMLLHDLGIPYRYEQKWVFNHREFYPDFTILGPVDHQVYIIELFGMMGDRSYAEKAYEKLKIYAANSLIPDKNLFCFFETDQSPLDILFVERTLRYFVLNEK